jgi:hypothetical protein
LNFGRDAFYPPLSQKIKSFIFYKFMFTGVSALIHFASLYGTDMTGWSCPCRISNPAKVLKEKAVLPGSAAKSYLVEKWGFIPASIGDIVSGLV